MRRLTASLFFQVIACHQFSIIGILCGYAIRSGKHPEGSQRPPGRPQYVHLRCRIKNDCTNCALKWERQRFDGELFIHDCMTSPAKRADVACRVKPEGGEGPTLCSISQRTAPGPLKARIWIWIYSIPSEKENRIKITRILSINALLSPSLRNIWGFLSSPRVLLHCSNERLEYYAARGPLWRHNGFYDVINAQSRQNKRAHP